MIRENNQKADKTWTWTYDAAGNILTKNEYAYTTGTLGTATNTVSYTYTDTAWGDLLTGYNGKNVTYDDAIGNLSTDGTWVYAWKQGRQLYAMSTGVSTWYFAYDADGMRTGRTSSSASYTYVYNGSQLSRMRYGDVELGFTYDATGRPLTVYYNGVVYYYALNLQGDVVAILNNSGAQVVGYTYDAWGKLLTTTGSMASTLGLHNPLRYRGYVYDTETGLYYLQSRYYNPEWGRFINADGYVSTGQGLLGNNMFAYCRNNPVTLSDATGNFPWLAIGIIAVCTIVGGILGWFADEKLLDNGAQPLDDDIPSRPLPPSGPPEPSQAIDTEAANDIQCDELTTGDRIQNAAVGAALGLATGGIFVMIGGVGIGVAAGSGTAYISWLGGSAYQTFAIGALAFNTYAIGVAPFWGLEVEPIEWEEGD